jgi:hypothetical protein
MTVEHDDLPDNWRELDSIGSFNEAIAAMRARYLAGEAIPDDGYFARRNALKSEAVVARRKAVQLNLFAAIDERFAEKPRNRPRRVSTKSAPPRRRAGRARGITRRVS